MKSDKYSNNEECITWKDIFPIFTMLSKEKLSNYPNCESIINEPITNDPSIIIKISECICTIAKTNFDSEPLARAFAKNIFEKEAFSFTKFDVRCQNALKIDKIDSLDKLIKHSYKYLFGIPNMGKKSVQNIFDVLTNEAINNLINSNSRAKVYNFLNFNFQKINSIDCTSDKKNTIEKDLYSIAKWNAIIGIPDEPVFSNKYIKYAPARIKKAMERLLELKGSDLINAKNYSPAIILDNLILSLEPRLLQIAKRRVFSNDPETLSSIAKEFKISGARIQQLDKEIRNMILNGAEPENKEQIEELCQYIKQRIGIVCHISHILADLPDICEIVHSAGNSVINILAKIDGGFTVVDDWVGVPSVGYAIMRTKHKAKEASDEYGVTPLLEIAKVIGLDLKIRKNEINKWAMYVGFGIHNEFVLTKNSTIGDRAAAILSIENKPMKTREILQLVKVDTDARYSRNTFISDQRFSRISLNHWALASWGMEEYTNIRDQIAKCIEENGKSVALNQVISRLTTMFNVSENSIKAYASRPPFKLMNGIISITKDKKGSYKSPIITRGLYKTENGFLFRFLVKADHLRGSGFPIPTAIAAILGINSGESVSMRSRFGNQNINWMGLQPALGSIRRFLEFEKLYENSEAFAYFGDDGAFDIIPVREPKELGNLCRAGYLVGILNIKEIFDEYIIRSRIAIALFLGGNSTWLSIIDTARARGDDDVVDLLLDSKVILINQEKPCNDSVAVDDILMLL